MSIFSVEIEESILLTIMEVEVNKEERTQDIKIIHVLMIHPKAIFPVRRVECFLKCVT